MKNKLIFYNYTVAAYERKVVYKCKKNKYNKIKLKIIVLN